MFVNNLPRVALGSAAAGVRICDLLIARPAPNHLTGPPSHTIIIIIIINRLFKTLSYQIKIVTKARTVTTPKQSGTRQFSATV